jgi:hypothetical protein
MNRPLPSTAEDPTSCKAYLFAPLADVSAFLLQPYFMNEICQKQYFALKLHGSSV